jgi:hypothetical protein
VLLYGINRQLVGDEPILVLHFPESAEGGLSQDRQINRVRKEYSPNGGCRGGVKLGQLRKLSKQGVKVQRKEGRCRVMQVTRPAS